jgi:hypothetical protein
MQLNPKHLFSINDIRGRAKALAILDAIVSPEWEDRYYSYDKNWSDDEEMASMRNGSGDEWFILFAPFGVAIKGLDHESKVADNSDFKKEIAIQLPASFEPFYNEPAFGMDSISYCYWCELDAPYWKKVIHPDDEFSNESDGSIEHLSLLYEKTSSYLEFADCYYEIELPLNIVEKIYALTPLTNQMVKSLNGNLGFETAIEFAKEIGYPIENIQV